MIVLEVLLLAFLVFCALATVLGKKMVSSIIIFMSYSAVMSSFVVPAGVPRPGHH